eukprot:4674994-Amphidinium_carterae.1
MMMRMNDEDDDDDDDDDVDKTPQTARDIKHTGCCWLLKGLFLPGLFQWVTYEMPCSRCFKSQDEGSPRIALPRPQTHVFLPVLWGCFCPFDDMMMLM